MDKVLNENEARALIERFAQKQQGGHFACPRCGRMTMDAESVTRKPLSRRRRRVATPPLRRGRVDAHPNAKKRSCATETRFEQKTEKTPSTGR